MKNSVWISFVAIVLSPCVILLLFSQQSTPLINAALCGIAVDSLSGEPIIDVYVPLAGVTRTVKTYGTGHFQFVTGQKLTFRLLLPPIGYSSNSIKFY